MKPIIPDKVKNKNPALPIKIISKAEIFGKKSTWDKIKQYVAEKAVDQIVNNADKIIKLVNKYEDYLLVYISNNTIRNLIDTATDILEQLIVEWKKNKDK